MNTFNSSSFFLAFLASMDHIEIQGAEHRASILSEATPHATLISFAAYPSQTALFSFAIVWYFFLNSIYSMSCIIFRWPELLLSSIKCVIAHLGLSERAPWSWSRSQAPIYRRRERRFALYAAVENIQSKRVAFFDTLLESGPGPVATSAWTV